MRKIINTPTAPRAGMRQGRPVVGLAADWCGEGVGGEHFAREQRADEGADAPQDEGDEALRCAADAGWLM